ncbi:MAG: type II secretion system protein GspG [Lentisphaerae bacterium]|nr:type II secretion system protein GspG [Lentisphaerota bacterium]
MARSQVDSLASRVLLYRQNHDQLPEPDTGLVRVLQEQHGRAKGLFDIRDDQVLDPWGTPYRYQRTSDSFWVLCAGSDRQFNTDDDLRADHTVLD